MSVRELSRESAGTLARSEELTNDSRLRRAAKSVGGFCVRAVRGAVRGVTTKTVAGVLAGVTFVAGSVAGCSKDGYDPTYSVERADPSLDAPQPRPKVGDGAQPPTTSTSASTIERPTTPATPAKPKISKIVCKDMLYVSSGIIAYSPVVDRLPGAQGLYMRDLRPVEHELIDNDPQPFPGPHQWVVAKSGEKVSDADINSHCALIDVKIAMRATVCIDKGNKPVCPESSVATYVPVDFNEDGAGPINRFPGALFDNPNDFHQRYDAVADQLPVPGGVHVPTR